MGFAAKKLDNGFMWMITIWWGLLGLGFSSLVIAQGNNSPGYSDAVIVENVQEINDWFAEAGEDFEEEAIPADIELRGEEKLIPEREIRKPASVGH